MSHPTRPYELTFDERTGCLYARVTEAMAIRPIGKVLDVMSLRAGKLL